ncbi:MAG: FAD-binding oxidoreductase, partial [Gemmatimonadetes bacterium]|nr:FAD-binding oxidoreductase [Gemmatimonadota bacterium]
MADVADAVVIGGGVNGASTAWHLAKRRAGRVVLVEKSGIGSGATSWSSGIVRLHYSLETLARMAWYGRQMFETWGDSVGGDSGFHRTGFLVLLGEGEVEGGRAVVAMQRRIGISARFIDVEEIAEVEPHLDPSGVAAGTYEPESGFADGLSTATAFADAARREGAEIRIGPVVTGIASGGEGVTRVLTDRGAIETRTAVVAAGYRSAGLLGPLGVDLPIRPIRHAIAIVG